MVWNELDEEIILRDLDDILYIDEILEFGDNEDFDIFFYIRFYIFCYLKFLWIFIEIFYYKIYYYIIYIYVILNFLYCLY